MKRQHFARWQAAQMISDAALCEAVDEMEQGLLDAELGGLLYKKRISRPGQGKSSGFRTLLSARIGGRYVFLHGFSKSQKANITHKETVAFRYMGKLFLELSGESLEQGLKSGSLLEVCCGKRYH